MATATSRAARLPTWVSGSIPLVAVVALVVVFLVFNPLAALRSVPPVEAVAVERTVLDPGEIVLELRNDGPDRVTIAQVLVNDAYATFEIGDNELARLESTTMRINYPWEEGLPLGIALVTSTGATVEHEIEVAALTPDADAGTFLVYASLGVYIGIIPVAIGLLWFPSLRRASKRWLGFFLAFTVGLLAFLLVDTVAEGFELAAATGEALDGLSLFVIGALAAVVGLFFLESELERRRTATPSDAPSSAIDAESPGHRGATMDAESSGDLRAATSGLALAYLIAAGIGLHNLGEGLAVGAALAAGEIALGTFLVLGFALHNTTEGLAIVAPMGGEAQRPSLWHFAGLGAVAGAPTIAGAIAGGFAFNPAWAALAFGIAAGAIAQVIYTIIRGTSRDGGMTSGYGALGFLAGLLFMYATGLLTA